MSDAFRIVIRDEFGTAVSVIEASIRNAGDWSKVWRDRRGPLAALWATSREEMFLSEGRSTGTPWPAYTAAEKKFYVKMKRWVLGVRKIDKGGILRWTAMPRSTVAARTERLYPSLTKPTHPEFVWQVRGNAVTMGTSVPYAKNHNDGTGGWTRKFGKKRTKSVTVLTPQRRLVAFGKGFTEDVRQELMLIAAKMGGKIGITSKELADRFKLVSRGGK